jgi:hypothetical protein
MAVNSTWARGQAWGIYGFTMARAVAKGGARCPFRPRAQLTPCPPLLPLSFPAQAYRYTGLQRFLTYAQNVSEYWIANTQADMVCPLAPSSHRPAALALAHWHHPVLVWGRCLQVPLWDFDAPQDSFRWLPTVPACMPPGCFPLTAALVAVAVAFFWAVFCGAATPRRLPSLRLRLLSSLLTSRFAKTCKGCVWVAGGLNFATLI